MAKVYQDNSQSIGNTPLVRLNHVTKGGKATVLVKIEGRNPAYSVKCRIGANMVWDARGPRRSQAGDGNNRAHQRQYRDRPGLRRCGQRVCADPYDAGNHER